MIYYYCPDSNEPIGGIKKIYLHVDILNKSGIPASVLHHQKGFRCDWFMNSTEIAYFKKIVITKNDFIALPEFYNLAYMNPRRRDTGSKNFWKVFETPAKKVIFNQGTYLTFNGNSLAKDELINLHNDKQIVAAMTVSEDGERFLRHAFPHLRIFHIRNSVNAGLFHPRTKKRQISFMPRRNRDHVVSLINALKFRGVLDDFTLSAIEDKTEKQVAEIMGESLLFLSFGILEGFSLPPAEAMACGCIVIGYHGMGGREYFNPDFCYPIETGNVLDFAGTVEQVLDIYKKDPGLLERKALNASSFIREQYSEQKEKEDILRCWEALLAGSN